MFSNKPTINPAEFRGFAREPADQHGLMDKEFAALCPPDVEPNTRILALCGTSDTEKLADPKEDGWFLSDFYLFHHLLQNSRKSNILL